MNIIQKPSSHYTKGRHNPIDTIIVHYISAINTRPEDPYNVKYLLNFLRKPIPNGNKKPIRVSAHYLIGRDGTTYACVDESNTAWHAGLSHMPDGRSYNRSVNDFSIGIELAGGKWEEFEEVQYLSLAELINDIKRRNPKITVKNVLGHCDVAPGRKIDPGKHFDWIYLYQHIRDVKSELTLTESMRALSKALVITSKAKKEISSGMVCPENDITSGEVVDEQKTQETANINTPDVTIPKKEVIEKEEPKVSQQPKKENCVVRNVVRIAKMCRFRRKK